MTEIMQLETDFVVQSYVFCAKFGIFFKVTCGSGIQRELVPGSAVARAICTSTVAQTELV